MASLIVIVHSYFDHPTLGFLAEISFTPLSYHPRGCLGCPEKQIRSRNYNLFVWSAVFQPKWNDIQKTLLLLGIFSEFIIQFWLENTGPNPQSGLKWSITDSFDTQGIPRGAIIVEISWFSQFFLRFLTCGAT
jgi:hypothetical protein